MPLSDWIALAALLTSIGAAIIAVKAMQETRRTNRIAILGQRVAIHDAFKTLALDALCQGAALESTSVEKFAGYATSADKYLPGSLAQEVTQFHEDCGRIVWARTLQQPADPEYVRRGEDARERVRLSAMRIQEDLLRMVRAATDA